MDPLAEMHLLLREHGWEPEVVHTRWKWSRPGWNFVFWTFALPPIETHPSAVWEEIGPVGRGRRKRSGVDVASLEKRLKWIAWREEIAQKK